MTTICTGEKNALGTIPVADGPRSGAGEVVGVGIRVESFGAVYREHYGAIAGLIYRRTGNAHVTEDLTSDVFVAAFAALDKYRGEVPVIVWLRRIAQNRVNRWVRREAGLRGILRQIPGVRAVIPAPAPKSERFRALESLLRLPVRQQEVISAHYLEGMSLEEVGLMLGVGVEAVKSRLARARSALRRELGGARAEGSGGEDER